jgi:Ca2+-binding RTX toxin-like protein
LRDGGNDHAIGGSSADLFYYGAGFTGADQNNGGGSDQDVVVLQGDYSGTLGAASLVGVEYLVLYSGSITRFGDLAGNTYDYNITSVDANVTAGQELRVNGSLLGPSESFTFNGSAETDGHFLVYAGFGEDNLTGGSGADGFFFEGPRFGTTDKVDGGAGSDVLILRAFGGLNTIVFGDDQLTGIEAIVASDRFATSAIGSPSYNLTLAAGNMGPSGTLIINGSTLLQATQTFTVDGSAINSGNLLLFGGAGDDSFIGGSGNDLIYAAGGDDTLTGGQGSDTFQFRALGDSTNGSHDHILDFTGGADVIDLHFIDANANVGGDQAFTLSNDGTFHNTAGELRTTFDIGNNWWIIEGDVNGDGVADFGIDVSTIGNAPLVTSEFIL